MRPHLEVFPLVRLRRQFIQGLLSIPFETLMNCFSNFHRPNEQRDSGGAARVLLDDDDYDDHATSVQCRAGVGGAEEPKPDPGLPASPAVTLREDRESSFITLSRARTVQVERM